MKLALITDPKGFPVVTQMRSSYHLVLAQYVRSDSRYADFYIDAHSRGDFIMIDNGAAEDIRLQLHELVSAAITVKADEIILPDVIADKQATLNASFNPVALHVIPPVNRAVVPQGNNADEWMHCAELFVDDMDFVTMCVPKHTERFEGGRVGLLKRIKEQSWHDRFNIHLLGIWGSPMDEVYAIAKEYPWVRGIDTAAPFAFAQQGASIRNSEYMHVGHTWGRKFDRSLALENSLALQTACWGLK